MIKNVSKVLQNTNKIKTIVKAYNFSTSVEKWDILTAVCLERKPVITPALNELENEYQKYLLDVEFERSLKSDHELQHEMETKQIQLLKDKSTDDIEVTLKQTAQEFADAAVEELSKFKSASRITEADNKNYLKSLNRKLDKHLVFVLNQKVGNNKYFILPQDTRQDGETLRQTAERVLKQSCGSNVKAQIYGNAPSGFYKYKYPKEVQKKEDLAIGAKVFFYFARYIKGEIPDEGLDFRWLDRQELDNILPPAYGKSVSQFLIDE